MNILHLFTITTEQCAYVTIADAMTHLYTEDDDRAFDQAVSEDADVAICNGYVLGRSYGQLIDPYNHTGQS